MALGSALLATPDAQAEAAKTEPATAAENHVGWYSADAPYILSRQVVDSTHMQLVLTAGGPFSLVGACPDDSYIGWTRKVEAAAGTTVHSVTLNDAVGGRAAGAGTFHVDGTAPITPGATDKIQVDCVFRASDGREDTHTLIALLTAAGRDEAGRIAILPAPLLPGAWHEEHVETEPEEPAKKSERGEVHVALMNTISMNDRVSEMNRAGFEAGGSILLVNDFSPATGSTPEKGGMGRLALATDYDLSRVVQQAGGREFTRTTHSLTVGLSWMPRIRSWLRARVGIGMGGSRAEEVDLHDGATAPAKSTFIGKIGARLRFGERFFGEAGVDRVLTREDFANSTNVVVGGGINF